MSKCRITDFGIQVDDQLLTPDEARKLAKDLSDAADAAEDKGDEPYDDAQDHTPCPNANHPDSGKRCDKGTIHIPKGFSSPAEDKKCPECEGAGWI